MRHLQHLRLLFVLCAATSLAGTAHAAQQAPATQADPSPAALAAIWEAEHGRYGPPQLVRAEDVVNELTREVRETPDLFRMEEAGRSVEGRPIMHLWFGRGPFHVLLWSQMHGDEATATSALFDVLRYVAGHRTDAGVVRMLDALTIHVVPMLNPDGAARFQRRNAQGIDVNRDALRLQSPEGRALKALRDRLQPSLGFNLHNQNWRTSAGRSRPATISLLAVAMDEARTETPGRLLAKRTCALIRDAVEAMAPGQVARYDDEFEVRAFGDNITKWGTPVVLIETGPYAGDRADEHLVRLNFVAIVSALDGLGSGRVQQADAARYESLPMNGDSLFTVLIANASIATGSGIAPFVGDVGLSSTRVVRRAEPAPAPRADARGQAAPGRGDLAVFQAFRVDDLGDLRVFAGLETLDATGLVLTPNQGWKEGTEVRVPDWSSVNAGHPLVVGAALDLALLEPLPDRAGSYRVTRIFPAERLLRTSSR